MSNFTGVTFAQQKVLPSDDAIIRRASLSDGVLYGCEMSYSGSTLTMSSGQLLICGRQIRHPAAQNWAVVDATSGFARLVLTVDMTKTSSKDNFEQVVDSIEYAASQDGFLELVQENVNVSGTKYQVVACVVSLGTGGITGIVDQIGPVEASGGGGLNFKVVGGLARPTNPAEGLVWAKTDVEPTGYHLSATAPENPTHGMLWIKISDSSNVEIGTPLGKDYITINLNSVSQYVNGAWVDVEAMSFQNGVWVNFLYYAFASGGNYVGVWEPYAYGAGASYSGTTVTPTITINDDGTMKVVVPRASTSESRGIIANTTKIDFSEFKTLSIKAHDNGAASTASRVLGVVRSIVDHFELIANSEKVVGSTFKVYDIDVSDINTEGYIITSFYAGGSVVNGIAIDSIWLK